jgi:hypothetical protein
MFHGETGTMMRPLIAIFLIAGLAWPFAGIEDGMAQTLRGSGASSPSVGGSVSSRMGSGVLRGFSGSLGRGTSVGGDGRGGVRVYNNGGTGRFVGDGSGGGRIYFPDGSSARVLSDGAGGKTVYLPGNTRRVPGAPGRIDSTR